MSSKSLVIDQLFAPEVASAIKTLVALEENDPDFPTLLPINCADAVHGLIEEVHTSVYTHLDRYDGPPYKVMAGDWRIEGMEEVLLYLSPGGWQ